MAFLTTLLWRFPPALWCAGHLRPEVDLYVSWCDLSPPARWILSSESGWREAGATCYYCWSGTSQWCGRFLTCTRLPAFNASVFVNTCLVESGLGLPNSCCTHARGTADGNAFCALLICEFAPVTWKGWALWCFAWCLWSLGPPMIAPLLLWRKSHCKFLLEEITWIWQWVIPDTVLVAWKGEGLDCFGNSRLWGHPICVHSSNLPNYSLVSSICTKSISD